MLGADVGMVERLGFLVGESQHFLDPRRVGNGAGGFLRRPGAHLLFHLHADGLEFEAHAFEHVDGDALAEFDQA